MSAKGAKIILNRDPRQILSKVAPFLKVDSDPYPFVDSPTGDITWMIDGYTTMSSYPYSEQESLSTLTSDSLSATNKTASQPNDQINYIRNSVKATVDAYTGKVTLYDWDSTDPVLKAWMKIFPNLVKPLSAMPADVKEHVRYPEDLFEVQRALIASPTTSTTRSRSTTAATSGRCRRTPMTPPANQPPYYVLAAPPTGASDTAEFQLTSPMKVNSRPNLAAFISVDSDPGPDYGKISVLKLPTNSVIDGPEQIFNSFNTTPAISKDITLLSSGGSTVIHGNLLTLPIGNQLPLRRAALCPRGGIDRLPGTAGRPGRVRLQDRLRVECDRRVGQPDRSGPGAATQSIEYGADDTDYDAVRDTVERQFAADIVEPDDVTDRVGNRDVIDRAVAGAQRGVDRVVGGVQVRRPGRDRHPAVAGGPAPAAVSGRAEQRTVELDAGHAERHPDEIAAASSPSIRTSSARPSGSTYPPNQPFVGRNSRCFSG